MLTLKKTLVQLNSWVVTHHISLQQYFLRFPYVNYQVSDLASIFRHKICDIISQIISLITCTSIPRLQKDQFFPKGIHSTQEINILCEVKKNLQLLRAAFLTVQTIKKINTAYIFSKLTKSIDLLDLSIIKSEKESLHPHHRNRSFDFKRQVDRSPLNLNQETSYRKMNQQEKTAKLKTEMRTEMNNYLKEKEQQLQQHRQRRISSGRKPIFAHNEHRKNSLYQVNQRNKVKQQRQQDLNEVNERPKKRYNYLQKLEDSLRKYKESQKKYDQYESPQIDRIKTQPSTEYFSTPQKRLQNSWDNQFPEFQNNPTQYDSLKQQLDFVKISGIKGVATDVEQNKWEQFCEDSIEKDPTAQNLDDSLELMKAEEGLNKTGTFILPTTHTTEETHEYSFSND